MHHSRYIIIVIILALVLPASALATAIALRTIVLQPSHCVTISKTRVCAAKQKVQIVSPSPIGQTFSGSGQATLAPFTVPANGTMLHWSITNDQYGLGITITDVAHDVFIGNTTATSGQSYLAPGTYTLSINSAADWMISF